MSRGSGQCGRAASNRDPIHAGGPSWLAYSGRWDRSDAFHL